MSKVTIAVLILVLVLSATAPAPIHSLSVSKYRTLFSLSHSLLTRVSNLRAERGDVSGANRAKLLSQKLERGRGSWLGCWGFAMSLSWDYVKNYSWSWRDLEYRELFDAVSDLNELVVTLSESMRVESEMERLAWVGRNYEKILVKSKRFFVGILHVFRQSGAVREAVEAVQAEVIGGDLLRDCLEIGSNDLKGLIQIVKDFVMENYYHIVEVEDDDEEDWSDL